jgi:hypothetical protein
MRVVCASHVQQSSKVNVKSNNDQEAMAVSSKNTYRKATTTQQANTIYSPNEVTEERCKRVVTVLYAPRYSVTYVGSDESHKAKKASDDGEELHLDGWMGGLVGLVNEGRLTGSNDLRSVMKKILLETNKPFYTRFGSYGLGCWRCESGEAEVRSTRDLRGGIGGVVG